MSKMSNFVLAMEEFTIAAVGITDHGQLLALAEMMFEDDMEVAYALQQYNPERYSSMTSSQILRDLSRAGME